MKIYALGIFVAVVTLMVSSLHDSMLIGRLEGRYDHLTRRLDGQDVLIEAAGKAHLNDVDAINQASAQVVFLQTNLISLASSSLKMSEIVKDQQLELNRLRANTPDFTLPDRAPYRWKPGLMQTNYLPGWYWATNGITTNFNRLEGRGIIEN